MLGFSTVRSWRGASFDAGTGGLPGTAPASQVRVFLQGIGISGIIMLLLGAVLLAEQLVPVIAYAAGMHG